MRNLDRKLAAIYWGFWIFTALLLAAPAVALGLQARRPSEQLALLLFGAGSVPVLLLIALGAAAFLRALKRNDGVVSTLEQLHAGLGGEKLLPTVWNPFIQPRFVTQHRGRELEVRFVRFSGIQAALQGGEWHLLVALASHPRLRFGLITRQLLLAPRANLAALKAADWDARLMLLSEDPSRAAMLLREPGVLGWTQQLFAVSGGFAKLQLAPVSTLNPLGTMYMGAWNPHAPPQNARVVVDAVTAIVERLNAMGEA